MKKKDYTKPTIRVVELQQKYHILTGSYKRVQSKNINSEVDTDFPDYVDGDGGNIWEAN